MFKLDELDHFPVAAVARLVGAAPTAFGTVPRSDSSRLVDGFFLDGDGQVVASQRWSHLDRDRMPACLKDAIEAAPGKIEAAVLIYVNGDSSLATRDYAADLAALEAVAPVWAVAFHATGFTGDDVVTSIPGGESRPVEDYRLSQTPIYPADSYEKWRYRTQPPVALPKGCDPDPDVVLNAVATTLKLGLMSTDAKLAAEVFYLSASSISFRHKLMGYALLPSLTWGAPDVLIELAGHLRGHARADLIALAGQIELSRGGRWEEADNAARVAVAALRQSRHPNPLTLDELQMLLEQHRDDDSYEAVADLRFALAESSVAPQGDVAV